MREGFIYNTNDQLAARIYSRVLYISTGADNLIKSNCFEIWQLNSSECTFYINNDKYELKNRDIIIIGENDIYGYDLQKTRINFTVIKIYPETFKTLIPKNQIIKDNLSLFALNAKLNNYIRCNEPLAERISSAINNISVLFLKKEPLFEISALAEIFKLLTNLAKYKSDLQLQTKNISKKSAKPDAALIKSIEYINAHLAEELTLEKISAVCGLSPNYYSNLFRNQTGTKLWDYVSEQRINLAIKYLLENPSEPIISVALRCGFNNCPNFNRTFKKITGQTPKKYKTLIVRQENFND